jgi:restriction endonuclease S subunit
MSSFLEYGTNKFDRTINLGKSASIHRNKQLGYSDLLMQRLEDISLMIRRGKNARYGDSNIQIIKSGQACGYNHFDFSKHYYVSEDFVSDERNLKKGDVLINSTGVGTAGRVTLFNLDGEYVADSHITIVRPDGDKVIPKYMLYALADIGFKNIEAMANGQSGQIELALKTVCGIKIPLPPMEIQQRIVAEIEQAEYEEKEISKQIGQIKTHLTALAEVCYQEGSLDKLRKVVHYATDRIDASTLENDTYVGVDNLLPDVGGKRPSDYVPSSGKVTAYCPNDILLSNIRPYLKKAWLADNSGGSSGDVLVLQVDNSVALPQYVFFHVSSDNFFEYEMQNIGSNVKMPRADKRKVLDYQIPLLPLDRQGEIVEQISQYEAEIARLKVRLGELKDEKAAIIKKTLASE